MAVVNGKYINAMPLFRLEQEFDRIGLNINRQNMAKHVDEKEKDFLDDLLPLVGQASKGKFQARKTENGRKFRLHYSGLTHLDRSAVFFIALRPVVGRLRLSRAGQCQVARRLPQSPVTAQRRGE